MNVFFGSIFIKKEELKEAKINYPIKLEYYKIINEEEFINKDKFKFGIKIVKTEYKGEKPNIEEKSITYLSNDEGKIEKILNILKNNEVTPICMREIIYEFSKSLLHI